MNKKKTLKELTIRDNFMFGAVMSDEENCRQFLQMTLGFPIESVEVDKEKCIIYHPEYKGIRLDIYARDKNRTHYNVEMQVVRKPGLAKRSRYYHSQVDMELLTSGTAYEELPNTYVIFICDFDPFGLGRYCYTFHNCCVEERELLLEDGCETIFLSTRGKNQEEVPESLVRFLEFVKADFEDSEKDFHDLFVKQLQDSVRKIKTDREMGERFMILEEMMRDERETGRREGRIEGKLEGRIEGKTESVLELLEELGVLPEELRQKVESQNDLEKLQVLFRKAAKAESLEQFLQETEDIL